MKKLIALIVILGGAGAAGWWYYKYGTPEVKPQITTIGVQRGSVVEVVKATGTLDSLRTVLVGTQVSGVVQELYADYNQIVKKGDLLAVLDPSLLQTQVDMQEANLTRSKVDLEQRMISLENDKTKLKRAQDLYAKNLVTKEALENAELAVKVANASIASTRASLTQTEATLKQAQVNLNYTRVYSPIDGVITVRSADKGQTVNASTSAPTLYTMATDLTTMKLTANIDEAEISKVRENEPVTFTVDAYLPQVFRGTVLQVRLNAKNTQNVVTYETVITVPNADLRLKPGMTAQLTIEVQRVDDVIRIPASALRFRPTAEMFEILKQPVPPEAQPNQGRGAGGGGRGGRNAADAGAATAPATTAAGATTAPAAAPPAATKGAAAPSGQQAQSGDRQRGGNQAGGGRGGNNQTSGGRSGGGRNMNLTPEQQKQMDAINKLPQDERRAAMAKLFGNMGGGRGGQSGGRGGQSGFSGGGQTGGTGVGMADRGAKTIEELMPPVTRRELPNQRVWMHVDGQLKPINNLRTGISDGQWTELVGDGLKEGDVVVTNFVIPGAKLTPATQQQGNPFQQQGGRGPGGGGGGRGGF